MAMMTGIIDLSCSSTSCEQICMYNHDITDRQANRSRTRQVKAVPSRSADWKGLQTGEVLLAEHTQSTVSKGIRQTKQFCKAKSSFRTLLKNSNQLTQFCIVYFCQNRLSLYDILSTIAKLAYQMNSVQCCYKKSSHITHWQTVNC
ncbi:hypothetical protein Tsp_06770 [Trichinella spiralis]|uniref:hypothetical protein n=1 Tax=Trichinella spiralis TaxID=6334 RepID=UPI0001EFC3F6|nr:hypothetical protein Tsp_06770 [Trichinella spiralis]